MYDHGLSFDGKVRDISGLVPDVASKVDPLEKVDIRLCTPAALAAGKALRNESNRTHAPAVEPEDAALRQASLDCRSGVLVANASAKAMGLAVLGGPTLGLLPAVAGSRSGSPAQAEIARASGLGLGSPGRLHVGDTDSETVAGLVGAGSGVIPALVRWAVGTFTQGTAAATSGP